VYRFLRLDGGEPSESWDDTAARHSRNVNTLSMDGWSLHYISWPWCVFRKKGLKKGQEVAGLESHMDLNGADSST
jgi:hypothetical protein